MKQQTQQYQPPTKQGLYDPQFEHDACGLGFIVNVDGSKTHDTVRDALIVLNRLNHRGAAGAEPNTGDGAGILLQIPHTFFAEEVSFTLPDAGTYGVGMAFLPQDDTARQQVEAIINEILSGFEYTLLGWRDVPTHDGELGNMARQAQPVVKQFFVQPHAKLQNIDLERSLYRVRRAIEKAIDSPFFYLPSFSSETIVYKGMLLANQITSFYPELADERILSAMAMVHSRFSTNTFPSWARAHPNRYLMHNGEINTIRGNVNWMKAREAKADSPYFDHVKDLFPIVDENGSDSSMFDNALEFFVMNGFSMAHAMMMMVPEPWQQHKTMSAEKKAFYEFYACQMEPWDGPAALGFCDGVQIGATLDRNGLRPARYTVTKDGRVIMASEVGVLDIDESNVAYKGRLEPGRMLLIDTKEQRIISDEELKETMANSLPYQQWLDDNMIHVDDIVADNKPQPIRKLEPNFLTQQQLAFGYSFEDVRLLLSPMAKDGSEAIGSMGDDTPIAVLSERGRLIYDYFKQLFAQVTNPPIDAIREKLVTATGTYLGSDGNIFVPTADSAHQIKLDHPILRDDQLNALRNFEDSVYKGATLPILYPARGDGQALTKALDDLCAMADDLIANDYNLLVLSDRGVDKQNAPIPSLLATSALHHHLIRTGQRTFVSLIVESADCREVHHFACLLGYGASAINPYLAFQSIYDAIDKNFITDISYEEAAQKYIKAAVKGITKVLSKMGISTIESYRGSQIFEALGLQKSVVDAYFTGTASRIEGMDIDMLAQDLGDRHTLAFPERPSNGHALPAGGKYRFRSDSEKHAYNPVTVHALQNACRNGDYDAFKKYSAGVNNHERKHTSLRGLLDFKFANDPIPLEEVESVHDICQRFKTGAMSYGSISKEAHETLAIAMNRIGGKSNTGEGGEDRSRFIPLSNGDSKRSRIKQVASGRFGVTSEYLSQADEIQIKMAQGAKPGEGGQLPGHKVYPWIANTRLSTPGVGLISPPPHHDIYSIEDLAQLIYDLKNVNPAARINVKLVSEVGVGTIAAGVAKAHADVILISGYGGGTGAAPQTSIKHTGLPWELGLAEAHQTLVLNKLRSRVRVETDGQLKTGRDVIIAALLGAEEYGFSTAPLVTLGCIMMRVCHLNTCPVGVATQNPELRKKFAGKPEHVINFMHFIAQEMRELMAQLGVRTIEELIGRTDLLQADEAVEHWKKQGIDLSNLLYQPDMPADVGRFQTITQDHSLEETLDKSVLLDLCQPAIETQEKLVANLDICNENRTVGSMVGGAISQKYGLDGLPADTITLNFTGHAGQSFGAFVPKGMTLNLTGDSNDYFGKGLSGGKLTAKPSPKATFVPEENIIIGNVALYGGTSGEAYIRGVAGERFAVRNSGITAVIEGVGDHGCEYMTGGRIVVLGKTGRNFAAGMSGGIAYVLDEDGTLSDRVNTGMVDLEPVTLAEEIVELQAMISAHIDATDSRLGFRVLSNWNDMLPKFVKIIPRDYKRVLTAMAEAKANGLSAEETALAGYKANTINS